MTNLNVQITHLEAKLLNLVIDVGAQDIPTFTIFGPIALPTDLHRLIYCQLCVYKRYPETQNVDDLASDLRVPAISDLFMCLYIQICVCIYVCISVTVFVFVW